jgi:NADPH-dependent glutamate synthase beta subunit-like oxidoreductase
LRSRWTRARRWPTRPAAGARERPVYVDRLPPCNAQCPAGEDIQGWLYHAEGGDYEAAWRHLTRDNPFPAIMGRVCYHSCEGACNRGKIDAAVGINSVERFLGRRGAQARLGASSRRRRTAGKRVLVVGAGPSGMSAAYHLRRLGHAVTVIEAGPLMGGMMRFGIPKYRLPREVLDAEMQRIVAMGVTLRAEPKVDDIAAEMRDGGFDATFLAVGAHIAKRAFIPAKDSSRILDAVRCCAAWKASDKPHARPPRGGLRRRQHRHRRRAHRRRLGATEAIIVYRRTREKMPAHDFEVEEALQEGVMVKWLSTIKRGRRGGALTIEKMALDDKGNPQPTGEFETLEADSAGAGAGPGRRPVAARRRAGAGAKDGVVQVDPQPR